MFELLKRGLAGLLAAQANLPAEKIFALLEKPKQAELGDVSFPCFELAKAEKKSPAAIANKLASDLEFSKALSGTLFEKAAAKGPYLNFFFKPGELAKRILTQVAAPQSANSPQGYGSSNEGQGKKIVIDYSSPNIAKPFHIGHLRSTIIGASLKRIFEFLGYEVVGVNHIGDWGTQFGMVMAAWSESPDEAALEKDPIGYLLKLYIDYNRRAEADDGAREQARAWFKRLEDGDPQARSLWERFRNLSLQAFEKVYDRLGIKFDHYWGESFYNDKLAATVEMIRSKHLLEKGEEGADIVKLGEEMPPALVRKSDGATLYITRDLAAAIYRFEKFSPEEMLYVVGRPQELHFRQLFLLLDMLGYKWHDRLKHIKFGHVQGLSTRRGEIVFLEDVLDEAASRAREKIEENIKAGKLSAEVDRGKLSEQVGIGAIIINDFKNHRERDTSFDWDQVLNFEGDTGPYLQYTHARINGILRKAGRRPEAAVNFEPLSEPETKEGIKKAASAWDQKRQEQKKPWQKGSYPSTHYNINITDTSYKAGRKPEASVNFELLSEPETKEVIKKLAMFPDIVREARREYEPFIICNYLFELTAVFNQFYIKCRVLGSGEAESPRLLLVDSVRQVIAAGLKLLGATALEQM